MSKNLSRMDFIRHHQGEKIEPLDELDRKALEGLRYLNERESITDVMARLDRRVVQVLDTNQSKRGFVRLLMSKRVVRAAAVILVLVAAVFLLTRSDSSDRLYNQYFTLAPNPYYQITRSAVPPDEDEFKKAFLAYELGQFDRAEDLLGQLIVAHPEKEDLPFYLAVVHMANDKVDQAIPLLELSISTTYRDINDRALWYLALANLQSGDRDQTMGLLQSIIDQELPKRSDAEELLKALR